MQNLKTGFFLIVGCIFFLGSFYLFLQQPAPEKFQGTPVIKTGGTTIKVEIADDDRERVQGLSGRQSLAEHTGVLFVFEQRAIQGFWMKEMFFPIDIIWIDENWQVVGVERGVKPETFPTVFYSGTPVQYVLELNSGEASSAGIDIGSKLYLDREF